MLSKVFHIPAGGFQPVWVNTRGASSGTCFSKMNVFVATMFLGSPQ